MPQETQEILLSDDHTMIRKGLRLLLELHLGFKQIAEVATCNALLKMLAKKEFSHAILDIILPDGNTLEIIPTIRSLYPKLQILVFSMQPAVIYEKAVKQYNIGYYISKDLPEEDTLRLLQKFLYNETPPKPESWDEKRDNPFSRLSPRELEVLHYVLKGMSTNEIAHTLNLKITTISTHKREIFDKTQTSNWKGLNDLAMLHNVNS